MACTREILAVALMATLGCEVADFEVQRSGSATIPRGHVGEDLEVMRLDDMEIVLAELEDTHDIAREDLSEAEITRFTLTVIDPAGTDLSFASNIEVFAEAEGLERIRIAHLDEFPPGEQVVDLETDDVDLRSYVAAPNVTLVARIDGVSPPADVRVQADADLHLGATMRGACNHM
jgi:hypothetical protein